MGEGDGTFELLEYGQEKSFGAFTVTLLPAGHVLGSAQLLLASDEGTLLYTGDFKLRHGLASEAAWPAVERDLLVEDSVTLPVQINGRKRGEVTVPRQAANAEIESAVLALDAVKSTLAGKPPRKVIVVPQRIVNVVV